MNVPTTPKARRTTAGLGAVALAALTLSACGSDAPPARNAATPTPTTPAAKPEAPVAPATPAKPLAVTGTSWPGVEARLTSARPRSGLLVVEIQLANTGAAPVKIENYSAADATMITDVSKYASAVFAPPNSQPAATTGLTQTLAPGESTTINAAFPLPATAQLATLTFPNLGLFEAIPLHPQRQGAAAAADDSERAKEKAENRASAMSAGQNSKRTP